MESFFTMLAWIIGVPVGTVFIVGFFLSFVDPNLANYKLICAFIITAVCWAWILH